MVADVTIAVTVAVVAQDVLHLCRTELVELTEAAVIVEATNELALLDTPGASVAVIAHDGVGAFMLVSTSPDVAEPGLIRLTRHQRRT